MTIWIILIICAYLVGSIPSSYLVARSHGIDLRRHGTFQVGGGNVWRTTSRKLGLIVGIFDFIKGILMVWIAYLQGLDAGQQLAVGLAAIIGHNWPVFLRFHGGRGIATLLGIVIVLPIFNVNNVSPWPSVIAVGCVVVITVIIRSSPLPVFFGAASLSLTTWLFGGETAVIMVYLAAFLIIVIKRLTAQPSTEAISISRSRLFLNRLLFDRDIADRTAWVNRKPVTPEELLDG
jgi:glycerol-3-phosphate acyltransferase PlsY